MVYEFFSYLKSLVIKKAPVGYGKRVTPAYIQEGDIVWVEWAGFRGSIGKMLCLGHDKLTKKLLFMTRLISIDIPEGYERRMILGYRASEFRNFNLLNQHLIDRVGVDIIINDVNLSDLERDLKYALDMEDYKAAIELRDKINNLKEVGKVKTN